MCSLYSSSMTTAITGDSRTVQKKVILMYAISEELGYSAKNSVTRQLFEFGSEWQVTSSACNLMRSQIYIQYTTSFYSIFSLLFFDVSLPCALSLDTQTRCRPSTSEGECVQERERKERAQGPVALISSFILA